MAHVFRGFIHGWFGSVETQHIMARVGIEEASHFMVMGKSGRDRVNTRAIVI